MMEQSGNSVTFYGRFTSNRAGKTGLTVTANIYRNNVLILSAQAATELGDGLYYYTLSSGSVNAEGYYIVVFKTTDTTVDAQVDYSFWAIDKAGIENLNATIGSRSSHTAADVWTSGTRTLTSIANVASDIWSYLVADAQALATTRIGRWLYDRIEAIKAKTDLIVSGTLNLFSNDPVGGTLTLYRDNAYKVSIGRPLFANTTFNNTKDLREADTITFRFNAGGSLVEVEGEATGFYTAPCDIDDLEIDVTPGRYLCEYEADFAGDKEKIFHGWVVITEDVR